MPYHPDFPFDGYPQPYQYVQARPVYVQGHDAAAQQHPPPMLPPSPQLVYQQQQQQQEQQPPPPGFYHPQQPRQQQYSHQAYPAQPPTSPFTPPFQQTYSPHYSIPQSRPDYYPQAPSYSQGASLSVYSSQQQLPPHLPPQRRFTPQSDHHVSSAPPPQQLQHQRPQPQRPKPPSQPALTPLNPHQPRNVAHVQIPVHRSPPSAIPSQHLPMPRSPKRRKSNDGLVCEPPAPQCTKPKEDLNGQAPIPQRRKSKAGKAPTPQRPSPAKRPQHAPVASTLLTSQTPPTPQQAVDYQAVLLSLSDEYIGAAQGMSSLIASGEASEEQIDECHGLLAAGMACLHSVLRTYRQPDARKEARIRLQLASLLLEETENDAECAEVLSRGIALCDRSRLSDSKYAMCHLEVRLLFKTNPRAALKRLDGLVGEATELKLTHWAYIYHFLRISLGLRTGAAADVPRQLEHLGSIMIVADQRAHVAVQITAACLETIVHLRSGTADAMSSAQRSLTAARTHQLGPEMKQLRQIPILVDCLTLACHLGHFSPAQIESSLQQMQNSMDTSKEGGWTKDGAFLVPIGTLMSPDIEVDTAGIIKPLNGQAAMAFQWLSRTQVMAVGYLMSGLARMHHNNTDKKSEAFLKEGMKMHKPRDTIPRALAASRSEADWQAFMGANSHLLLMFAQCDRSHWTLASRTLQDLKQDMTQVWAGVEFDACTLLLAKYLEAVIHHGLGELEAASTLYQAPELRFNPDDKDIGVIRDCQALATLSHIQILRSRFLQQQEPLTQQMLNELEPYCSSHPNQSLQAAYHILRATSAPFAHDASTLKKKQFLESAVRSAQATKNSQILCMVLNLMRHAFFNNIVGQQAEQNGRAARTLAKRINSPLWLATADGMYSHTLELCGMLDQAAEARMEGEAKVRSLPEGVRTRLHLEDGDTKVI